MTLGGTVRNRVGRVWVTVMMATAASAACIAMAPTASSAPVDQSTSTPRADLVDPCLLFTDPDFAYSPEQVSDLMAQDYATLRKEIAECQGKALTELKPPKLKKPKVPKIAGMPPTFWVYVMGSQVETWAWSLPLDPDPVMCTSAIAGQRFTLVSPIPTGAIVDTAVGYEVAVDVKAGVKDSGWGQGSDCDPTNWSGSVDGGVSFDLTMSGIRLNTFISSDRDLRWEFAGDSRDTFTRAFSKKDKAAILNPRKGVLTFVLTHSDAGSAQTDTGTCITWGDEGSCTWAHSWGVKIILVRADPMDLVNGP